MLVVLFDYFCWELDKKLFLETEHFLLKDPTRKLQLILGNVVHYICTYSIKFIKKTFIFNEFIFFSTQSRTHIFSFPCKFSKSSFFRVFVSPLYSLCTPCFVLLLSFVLFWAYFDNENLLWLKSFSSIYLYMFMLFITNNMYALNSSENSFASLNHIIW